MKINWETKIIGNSIELVPYRTKFVERYNQWMQDPYLLEMTASEPMTIEEEYENQLSWKNDENSKSYPYCFVVKSIKMVLLILE